MAQRKPKRKKTAIRGRNGTAFLSPRALRRVQQRMPQKDAGYERKESVMVMCGLLIAVALIYAVASHMPAHDHAHR